MSKATTSVVLIQQGDSRAYKRAIPEVEAGGVITPGDKLAIDWTATPPTATRSAGTTTLPAGPLYVAIEKLYDDGNSSDAVDADYASGERVRYVVPQKGDVLYVLAAVGVSLAVGDLVIDGGTTTAGKFDEVSPATPDATVVASTIKGLVRTAVTGGGAAVRFEMEVI